MSAAVELPEGDVEQVELEVETAELRRRAALDELAPRDERTLLRYLVYLGAGYLEAERLVDAADSWPAAFAALHRLHGAFGGRAALVRFHFGDSARGFAEEKRAEAAHERMAGAYAWLAEKMRAEIAVREERLRNLERALGR